MKFSARIREPQMSSVGRKNAIVSGSLQMGLAPALSFREKNSLKEAKVLAGRCKFRLIEVEFPNKTGDFLWLSGRFIFRPYQLENQALLMAAQRGRAPQRRTINKFQPFLAVYFFSPHAFIIAMHVSNFVTHRGRHRMHQPQRAVKPKLAFYDFAGFDTLAATHILLT